MSLYTFMFTESASLDIPWFIHSTTGRTLTGNAMKARIDALAQSMSSLLHLGASSSSLESHMAYGIRDVVALVSPNSLDFGTVVWASHKLGCTVASIGGGSTVDELKHQFSLSGTRTVIAHIDALDRVLRAAEECQIPANRIVVISDHPGLLLRPEYKSKGVLVAEELILLGESKSSSDFETCWSPIAFLCFSSGTTGLPKAVVVPHSAIIANVTQLKNASVPTRRISTGDKALGAIPFSHMFGLVTLIHLCPHLGITTVAFKSMPSFSTFLETIVRLRIGHLFLAPPLVNAFVKHPATSNYDLTFLRSAMIAAAPLDSAMETAFRALGGPEFLVTQGFGMTECGGLITGLPFGTPPRSGSVGRLLSLTDAKIVDEHGNALEPSHRGHFCVRGPQVCPGYLGNTQATQAAFDADGFLLTGDIAEMTGDGYLYIVDRLKYMIKNKGYQVSPAELEAHLLSLELVSDAGVIGRQDDRCGQVPVAFIVLSAVGEKQADCNLDVVANAITRSVQEAKSEYKWLHDIYFVKAIPRLPSGKIISKRLQQMLDNTKPVDCTHPRHVDIIMTAVTAQLSRRREPLFHRISDMLADLLKYKMY
ncbi:hypothetical protein C8R43DRAFT_967302 [Mycena crocata]|nr:hypothetical protein C8R43DRAFT_967302 [Mycena crocata]